jgi:prevent-host-death family protein
MIYTGIRDLKARLSMYIKKVQQGHVITITNRGDAIALIAPNQSSSKAAKQLQPLIATGLIKGALGKPKGLKQTIHLPPSKSLSRAILEDRR